MLSWTAFWVGTFNYGITVLCVVLGDIALAVIAGLLTVYCYCVWLWARMKP